MKFGRLERPCRMRHTVYYSGVIQKEYRNDHYGLYGGPMYSGFAHIWPESDIRYIVATALETRRYGRRKLTCYHVLPTFDAAEMFVRTLLTTK